MWSRRRVSVSIALLLSTASALAHDFWIEPTHFAPELGQVVGLRLRVGVSLVGDPVGVTPEYFKQFVVEAGQQRRPVNVRDSADPAGQVRITAPGLQVVGYHGQPSRIELGADKFNAYLKDEGLEAVLKQRARRKQSQASARELYARCAKSLLQSGPADAAQHDQRLGFALELIAERNPYAMRVGQALPLQLIYEGRPLRGALVVALNSLNPGQKLSARTDRDGRVRLALPPGGMWLVKAVHMVPAPAGSDADWSSLWASLSFETSTR
jgi:uncharacterized GH25 family protein